MPQASTAQGGPCCTAAHSLLATSAAGAVQQMQGKDKTACCRAAHTLRKTHEGRGIQSRERGRACRLFTQRQE